MCMYICVCMCVTECEFDCGDRNIDGGYTRRKIIVADTEKYLNTSRQDVRDETAARIS